MNQLTPHHRSGGRFALVVIWLLTAVPSAGTLCRPGNFTRYVDPFIGTGGHGHTFPGATVPFGMVQLSPDTRVEGWDACSGYHYSDSTILGFSHTHLSGTGVADYGDILIAPYPGMAAAIAGTPSRFSHSNEHASPGYYSVMLDRGGILAELIATTRVGVHRYTFPKSDSVVIAIDLRHGLGPDRVLESEITVVNDREVVGFRRSAGWAKNQYIAFVARFSKPFVSFAISTGDSLRPDARSASGTNVKAYLRFSPADREAIIVKVGLSSTGIEGARKNLDAEMPEWDFDRVRSEAEEMWERELSKIEASGGPESRLVTFYTALYHAMLAPNVFSDVDGMYRGMDGSIHRADGFTMYTVFSLWDTFRAEHPLLTLIDRTRSLDFVKSLIAKYDESTVLPVWELASNETWCMIGYNSVPVIVDAYMKGIRDFDVGKAYEAMKHSAMLDHFGLKGYRDHGYVPGEMESESVSKTLEYAYDDWCIATMAKALGKSDDDDLFSRRAQYYRDLFDPSTGFMRGKDNGCWVGPFDPTAVNIYYTEANAWQYSFFVPQDVNDLIALNGGSASFVAKLDSLFETGAAMSGRNQADISGMIGQYAQGNEPSHHVAYLYDYAGAPWRTQEIVRRIMDSLYTTGPEGLCGNDDCGQMSAWYVMSAMGLYEVCPGRPIYSIGSPVFDKIILHPDGGKEFAISTTNNSGKNTFIRSATLNGATDTKVYLTHEQIIGGGKIEFLMGREPDRSWGTGADDRPQAISNKPIVPTPVVEAPGRTFSDSISVALACSAPGAKIHYTIDGTNPTGESPLYRAPMELTSTTTLKAFAEADEMIPSEAISAEFLRHRPIGTLTLLSPYSSQYPAGGSNALIDGLRGGPDFRLGTWQGFEGNDLNAVIDLGTVRPITVVGLGCLQDISSWIFFPTSIQFAFSVDGQSYTDSVSLANEVSPKDETIQTKEFETRLIKPLQARFVRIVAKSMGRCPEWHKAAGSKAWLFADEITVQ